jgi:hypothetical protein
MIRMLIVGYCYGIRHERRLCEEVKLHLGYRGFVGVAVVLPLIGKFTRFVERILPERGSPLTGCLDPSALATPIVAVEAVRRTVARAVGALCNSLDASLTAASRGDTLRPRKDVIPFSEVTDALRQAQEFISVAWYRRGFLGSIVSPARS